MRTTALVLLALILAGCARGAVHPATAGCLDEPVAAAPLPGESGVYRAAPLTLTLGEDLAQVPSEEAPTPMLIPIGDTLRGCPGTNRATRLPSESLPFLGVACGRPNWIDCQRVGVGVRTELPARLVVVRIAGRLVTLRPEALPRGAEVWQGYLLGVSLRHGPLRLPVTPHEDYWYGSPEVWPRVRVTAFFADGRTATTAGRVLLHPGFG